MKKVITTVLFTLLAVGVFAQGGKKRGEKPNYTPEQMAELQTKKMTLALDLSEAQQKQLYELNRKNAIERQKAMEERKALKAEDKKPSDEEKFSKRSERLDKMIAHKAAMKKILTPEQYEKWEKMAKRKGEKRKGHMLKHGKRGDRDGGKKQ